MKRTVGLIGAVLCGISLASAAGVGPATADPGPWSVVQIPVPADSAANPQVTLGQGACGAPGRCFVPGSYRAGGSRTKALLVSVSDGSVTTRALPPPPDAPSKPYSETFSKVACLPASTCVAIGEYELDGFGGPVFAALAIQTGSTWSVITAPVPAGFSGAKLTDVTCSSGLCFAVGSVVMSDGHTAPLVERFADGTWTPTVLPTPAGVTGDFVLSTVSCSAPQRCVAAGTTFSTGGRLLGASWNGTTWTTRFLPPPPDNSRYPVVYTAVSSCVPRGTCHVLNPYRPIDKSVKNRPADYAKTGNTWTTTGLPNGNPPLTRGLTIYALQCNSEASCIAVGLGSSGYGVIATLTPSGWSVAYGPATGGKPKSQLSLSALSCLPDESCTAFGVVGFSSTVPVATTLGSSPTTTALPLPPTFREIGSSWMTTAVYDDTRQLVAGYYITTDDQIVGALWMRTV